MIRPYIPYLSQPLRIISCDRLPARFNIVSHHRPTYAPCGHVTVDTPKRPAGLIQRHFGIPERGIGKRLIEVDRIALTEPVGQDQRLVHTLLEQFHRVRGRGCGGKFGVHGLGVDAGTREGVGHDDLLDLRDVPGWEG